MFSILPLELPVILRVSRGSMQRQDVVSIEQRQDLWRTLAGRPIETHDQRWSVGLEVGSQSGNHAVLIVVAYGGNRRPIRHCGIRGDEPEVAAVVAQHVHGIEAANDAGMDHAYARAPGLALVLHLDELATLELGSRAPRDTGALREARSPYDTVRRTYELPYRGRAIGRGCLRTMRRIPRPSMLSASTT